MSAEEDKRKHSSPDRCHPRVTVDLVLRYSLGKADAYKTTKGLAKCCGDQFSRTRAGKA